MLKVLISWNFVEMMLNRIVYIIKFLALYITFFNQITCCSHKRCCLSRITSDRMAPWVNRCNNYNWLSRLMAIAGSDRSPPLSYPSFSLLINRARFSASDIIESPLKFQSARRGSFRSSRRICNENRNLCVSLFPLSLPPSFARAHVTYDQ